MPDVKIADAFLKGMETIFKTMFTESIELYLLNEYGTKTNIYDETEKKLYKTPIELAGKIITTFEKGEEPIEGIKVDAVVSIPTKQLIDTQVSHSTPQDLETLKKAKIVYGSTTYLVDLVKPKTLIADVWQVYDFVCHIEPDSSLSV